MGATILTSAPPSDSERRSYTTPQHHDRHGRNQFSQKICIFRRERPHRKNRDFIQIPWIHTARRKDHYTYKTRVSITDMYFRNYSIGPTDLFKVFPRIFIHYRKSLNVIRKPLIIYNVCARSIRRTMILLLLELSAILALYDIIIIRIWVSYFLVSATHFAPLMLHWGIECDPA